MQLPGFLASKPVMPGAGQVPAEGEGCQISLDGLELGHCGVITDLDLAESDDKRLRTLGICPGRRAWMVRNGDPMVVKVMGSRLGLARELARQVTVEICAPPCSIAEDLEPEERDRGDEA